MLQLFHSKKEAWEWNSPGIQKASGVCCKPRQRNTATLVLKLSYVGGGDCAVIVLRETPLAKSPATRMLIYLGLK